MVCESWKAKIDAHLDGEVPEQELRTFGAHVRSCPSCSADALKRLQMKRAIHAAGRRYTPSSGSACSKSLLQNRGAVLVWDGR
jgi:anti-sigma factor RsiW